MHFQLDSDLLAQARTALAGRQRLYWLVGGAGAGKTTLSRLLAGRFGLPVYDMDAHIYGSYHARFTARRHPANHAWSTAADGLAWLLALSWEEYDAFNRAALPEYLHLLTEDLRDLDPEAGLLVDGGIIHPALLAQALPRRQIVCLAGPSRSSALVWESTTERRSMKEAIGRLPDPAGAWQHFLELDERITRTILADCRQAGMALVRREGPDWAEQAATEVARRWGL